MVFFFLFEKGNKGGGTGIRPLKKIFFPCLFFSEISLKLQFWDQCISKEACWMDYPTSPPHPPPKKKASRSSQKRRETYTHYTELPLPPNPPTPLFLAINPEGIFHLEWAWRGGEGSHTEKKRPLPPLLRKKDKNRLFFIYISHFENSQRHFGLWCLCKSFS